MTYFNKFPRTIYQDTDGTISQVKDVLRRVVFTDESILQDSNYDEYLIQDNETPDMVSQKFFQDPNLHWIIILYNTLIDPFYTFPLSRNSFEEYIDKKYEGQALYLAAADREDNLPFFSSDGFFEQGDTIASRYFEDGVEKFNNTTQRGLIKRVDYGQTKLELFNQIGDPFAADDVIVKRRTILETIRARVARVIDSRFAPHHFELEKSNGERVILNPMGTPPDGDGNQFAYGEPNFENNNVDFSETLLSGYIYQTMENIDQYVITNELFEQRENDKRRRILIPKKFIVQKINKTFENLVRK